MTRSRPRSSLSEVAATAGVSQPTVSKVINGRPDVAASTRTRVQAALREHEYTPPSARRPRTATIALFFDDLLSPYASELLSGVIGAANEASVGTVVNCYPHPDDPASGRAWDGWLARPQDAGAIIATSKLAPERIEAVGRAGLALVVIDAISPPRSEVTSVGSTNFAGGLAAITHLLELGHRRVAFIGGQRSAACSQSRLAGYRTGLEQAGLEPDPSLVGYGDFSWDSGLRIGTALLGQPTPPTAVFAASDAAALGVLEAARRLGLRVPEDLSVVGFDDTYLAAWSTPPLTTVNQPLRDMGAVALRTVLRLAAGASLDSHHVELATRLVVRGSTARVAPAPRRR